MTNPADDSPVPGPVADPTKLEIPEVWPTDIDLVRERLAAAEAHRSKQLTWLLIGATPAALLPVLAALWTDNNTLAVVFVLLAMVIQAVRWRTSVRAVEELEAELVDALAPGEGDAASED